MLRRGTRGKTAANVESSLLKWDRKVVALTVADYLLLEFHYGLKMEAKFWLVKDCLLNHRIIGSQKKPKAEELSHLFGR